GTFDPVHYAHLLLAECCREQCQLDEVWFMPAARSPHKLEQQFASDEHRLAMLELACGGHDAFRVSKLELERGGVSYTVDTLRQLKEERPGDELFLLMGGDNLNELATWREPEVICELAIPLVAHRPGSPKPDASALAPFVSAARLAEIGAFGV